MLSTYQLLPHIQVESQRAIHWCMATHIPPQEKPQSMSSNLKVHLCHEHIAIDPIKGTVYLSCWLEALLPSNAISLLRWLCRAMHPSLSYCARLAVNHIRRVFCPLTDLVFNSKCLFTLHTRKAWWGSQFSCRWPNHGSTVLLGTSSTNIVTWQLSTIIFNIMTSWIKDMKWKGRVLV